MANGKQSFVVNGLFMPRGYFPFLWVATTDYTLAGELQGPSKEPKQPPEFGLTSYLTRYHFSSQSSYLLPFKSETNSRNKMPAKKIPGM